MINVLMTGAGSPGGPGIIRALGSSDEINLTVADMDPHASGRHLHSKFIQIPPATDKNFIEKIAGVCKQNKIQILFPLVTRELSLLASAKEYFYSFGTVIIVSDPPALETLNDKGNFYEFLTSSKLECPEYYVTDSVQEFLSKVNEYEKKGYPCVIKPCLGNGSRGVRIITGNISRFDLLFNEKPNSLYMTVGDLTAAVKDKQIPRMLVSEYLPGEEVTVDVLIDKGEVKLILTRRRDKISGGISVKGEFITNKQIEDSVVELCSNIKGLYGPVGFQMKKNLAGHYHFIECNPRIQGTSVASAGLGINIPKIAIEMAAGKQYSISSRRDGVSFSRYYQEVFYDF